MHRIVCAYKKCSKGAALARGDITKGYAIYVRLVILILMKLSLKVMKLKAREEFFDILTHRIVCVEKK